MILSWLTTYEFSLNKEPPSCKSLQVPSLLSFHLQRTRARVRSGSSRAVFVGSSLCSLVWAYLSRAWSITKVRGRQTLGYSDLLRTNKFGEQNGAFFKFIVNKALYQGDLENGQQLERQQELEWELEQNSLKFLSLFLRTTYIGFIPRILLPEKAATVAKK